MEKIRDLRNRFAHSIPDTTVEFIREKKNFIRLMYYKNGKKEFYEITKELIDRKLRDTSTVISNLRNILELVSGGKSGLIGHAVK